jgi:competence protein ComEC
MALLAAAGSPYPLFLVLAWLAGALGAFLVAIRRGRPDVAAVAVGAASVALRIIVATALSPAAADPGPPPTANASWVAEIERVGSTQGGMQRALIDVTRDGTEKTAGSSWVVYAFLPRYPVIAPGDRISFDARLELPPDGPGFRDVLVGQGAAASVRVGEMELLPRGGDPLAALESMRRAAGELLARTLPQPEAGLAAGILIGLRDLVDRDLAADFTTAGLSHVVAISGWNIAVVGAVMVSLLRWLPRRPRSIVVLVAIALYTLLAGAGASVVRAAVMGGVVLVVRESGRSGRAAAALGLAVWLLLLADPRIASDVGFQLSVAATGGLLAWGPRLQHLMGGRAPRRTPGWLVESAAVSLAAQAATLPLILLHFGRLSLVSPLANLLAAPFIAPSMLAALVALLAGAAASLGVPQILLIPAAVLGNLGLAVLVAVARLSASLPLASLSLPPPFDLATAVASAVGVGLFGTALGRRFRFLIPWKRRGSSNVVQSGSGKTGDRTRPGEAESSKPGAIERHGRASDGPKFGRGSRATAAVAAALLVVVVAIGANRPDGRFRMTVLDIGQGDAILLEGSRGARMLIDGGPDPDLLLSRLDERIPAWDRRLDLLVLSHPHEDHVAGMALLLGRYRVGTIAETGMLGNGPGDRAFRAALAQLGLGTVQLAAGDSVQLDDATLSVLWPRRGEVPLRPSNDGSSVNNVSVVFDLRLAHRRMLLTGDIQEDIDPQLLAAGLAGEPPVDVLKVAHHGSRTATTSALLSALHPKVALISAGLGNPYGHPSPATIDRLHTMGAQVLRTDLDGNLTVTSDGSDLQVSSSGGRPGAAATPRGFVAQPVVARFPGGRPTSSPASSVARVQPVGGARLVLDVTARAGTTVGAPGLTLAPGLLARSCYPSGPVRRGPSIPAERRSACYDRVDDRSLPRRSLPGASRAQSVVPLVAAHDGGRGDCRIPGRANGASRHPGRPPPGRERSPPSRRRQGLSAWQRGSRRRRCPLARRTRVPRAL